MIFQSVLKRVGRSLAERSRWSLNVLFAQNLRHVRRLQVVLRHEVGLEPDAHTVGVAKFQHFAHTVDTLDFRHNVYVEVVGEEGFVILSVVAHQGTYLQETVLLLLRCHSNLRHLRRQQSLRLRHTVLHVHRGHVGVSALLEVYVDLRRTRVCGGRGDVEHVLHTVDALLQRHDDRLHHSVGISTGVCGLHAHRWRRNVGILFHRQVEQGDQSHHYYQHSDAYSHHWAFDKYIAFHSVTILNVEC